jgi:hypothetical protein
VCYDISIVMLCVAVVRDDDDGGVCAVCYDISIVMLCVAVVRDDDDGGVCAVCRGVKMVLMVVWLWLLLLSMVSGTSKECKIS